MQDTVTKTYRHLNFFRHQCELEVRVPRVKPPDRPVRQISAPWSGKLSGFTLLFGAFVLVLAREMTFSGAARICGLSVHRIMSLCERYVNEVVSTADLSEVRRLAIDETSRAKGHDYVSLFADADRDPTRRRVLLVAEGREPETVADFARNLRARHVKPSEIEAISIDKSPAFIRGVEENFPKVQITFDKFHVSKHASEAIDEQGRREQKLDPSLKRLRWVLLKDCGKLTAAQRIELDGLVAHMTTSRTARAWHYREQLREILTRKQPNVVRSPVNRWCSNVLRSKVEPKNKVAQRVRSHFGVYPRFPMAFLGSKSAAWSCTWSTTRIRPPVRRWNYRTAAAGRAHRVDVWTHLHTRRPAVRRSGQVPVESRRSARYLNPPRIMPLHAVARFGNPGYTRISRVTSPGWTPSRLTASSRPSTDCSRPPSARRADTSASGPSAPSCS